MGVVAALAGLLTQEITWEQSTGWADSEGNRSYAAGVVFSARVVRKRRFMRDISGREAISMSRAYVSAEGNVISTDDRITLLDGTQPKMLSVESSPDLEGGDPAVVLFFEG